MTHAALTGDQPRPQLAGRHVREGADVAGQMGLINIAGLGGKAGEVGAGAPVTPCGRCRQVLNEVAALGASDPLIWCVGEAEVLELRLSDLLPKAFGPDSLS